MAEPWQLRGKSSTKVKNIKPRFLKLLLFLFSFYQHFRLYISIPIAIINPGEIKGRALGY